MVLVKHAVRHVILNHQHADKRKPHTSQVLLHSCCCATLSHALCYAATPHCSGQRSVHVGAVGNTPAAGAPCGWQIPGRTHARGVLPHRRPRVGMCQLQPGVLWGLGAGCFSFREGQVPLTQPTTRYCSGVITNHAGGDHHSTVSCCTRLVAHQQLHTPQGFPGAAAAVVSPRWQ